MINGPLCVQAYAMAEQTGAFVRFSIGDCLILISSLFLVGKPMESSNCAVALFPWPIAVADLPEVRVISALLSIHHSCHRYEDRIHTLYPAKWFDEA
jgi:hypothetical protein